MKTITVAQLRQNPTEALHDVEGGETYAVTRHRREIARLVPTPGREGASAAELMTILRATPLLEDWAAELAEQRGDFDQDDDPWGRGA